jgi:thiamine biosynthesis lipoprotein
MAFGILAGVAAAGEPDSRRFEFRETHMASEFSIILYGPDEGAATAAARAAFDRIAELDKAFNDYDPESEVSRLSARSGTGPVEVSADLFDILARAREASERSGGAFDVTIQPVVKLWRRARRMHALPREDQIQEALARTGWEKMELDPEKRTVWLKVEGMGIDLGGIAKGYAGDEALKILRAEGHGQALVAGAGDVVLGDPPPGAAGWRVEAAPLGPGNPPEVDLVVSNVAVSTSGDAERFVEIDGVRYSHIVDPRTGIGKTGRGGVTVVAPEGATAEGLATAAYLLRIARGVALVEETPGASCLAIEEGEPSRITYSKRFEGTIRVGEETSITVPGPPRP